MEPDNFENELLKYIKLNKAKIIYTMIINYQNSLRLFKELKELNKKQKLNRKTRNKKCSRKKLNVLNDTLESLKRFNVHEDEINEIQRLKEVKYSNNYDRDNF